MLKQLLVSIACGGSCLYCHLNQQNDLTHLKMDCSLREAELEQIQEENRRLAYQVEQFESPNNLFELARRPEFSHLKHPALQEILTVQEEIALNAK